MTPFDDLLARLQALPNPQILSCPRCGGMALQVEDYTLEPDLLHVHFRCQHCGLRSGFVETSALPPPDMATDGPTREEMDGFGIVPVNPHTGLADPNYRFTRDTEKNHHGR